MSQETRIWLPDNQWWTLLTWTLPLKEENSLLLLEVLVRENLHLCILFWEKWNSKIFKDLELALMDHSVWLLKSHGLSTILSGTTLSLERDLMQSNTSKSLNTPALKEILSFSLTEIKLWSVKREPPSLEVKKPVFLSRELFTPMLIFWCLTICWVLSMYMWESSWWLTLLWDSASKKQEFWLLTLSTILNT